MPTYDLSTGMTRDEPHDLIATIAETDQWPRAATDAWCQRARDQRLDPYVISWDVDWTADQAAIVQVDDERFLLTTTLAAHPVADIFLRRVTAELVTTPDPVAALQAEVDDAARAHTAAGEVLAGRLTNLIAAKTRAVYPTAAWLMARFEWAGAAPTVTVEEVVDGNDVILDGPDEDGKRLGAFADLCDAIENDLARVGALDDEAHWILEERFDLSGDDN